MSMLLINNGLMTIKIEKRNVLISCLIELRGLGTKKLEQDMVTVFVTMDGKGTHTFIKQILTQQN